MQEEQQGPQDQTLTNECNIFNDAINCYTFTQLLTVREGVLISLEYYSM